ncbi:MAG: hypothetical protein QGH42_09670 [Kiritimatiellia bacterium]|jgi:hypothetical protein|nr:hypothetical protein [Kiritimatiellia bacterium]MDP7024490.1 hypothetical protein [Kiritimatiellia bacterium]
MMAQAQAVGLGALLITLRIFVPGLSLGWLLMPSAERSAFDWERRVTMAARAALVGVVTSALIVFVLGQAGCYRLPLEVGLLALVCMAGLLPALLRRRREFVQFVRACVPVMGLCLCGTAAILALPGRSEWMLGGWDPGVYISEGVALERTGSFYPEDPLLTEQFSDEEAAVFTRGDERRTERFPGVVVDALRQSLSYEFFRLHPALIAMFYRCGGIAAALRGNTILAMFVVLLFGAMLLEQAGRPQAVFATLVLMTQPIWLYHTHVPVSEMLHLLLFMGIGLLLPQRHRDTASALWLALLILGLVLNRFSFLPFGSMLIVGLAGLDLNRERRGRVWCDRCLQWGALALGAWLDGWVSPASIQGWSKNALPVIITVTGCSVLAAACLDVVGSFATIRRRFSSLPPWIGIVLGWFCVLAVVGLYCFGRWGEQTKESDNLYRLIPYLGPVALGCAVAGLFLLVHRRTRVMRTLGAFLLVLFSITFIVLVKKWTKDFYPWATRRYLATAVPLVAVLAACPFVSLWTMHARRPVVRSVAALLFVALLGSGAKHSWHAWSRAETHGVRRVLDRVADRIDANDIVVADTPTWGTPLKFIYGKEVLNGKHMWRRKDAVQMQVGLDALKRLHDDGRRIRFLTTTRTLGMDIYPVDVAPVTLDWQSEESVLEEINHSQRADDFEVREKRNVFRLFTWHPADAPSA